MVYTRGVAVAWDKSKAFLDKVQLGSIVLYLVCLGGRDETAQGGVYSMENSIG